MKKLSDIALNITEEEYRNDPALSFSIIARFDKEGFANLNKLFDKIETPSLTFGKMVDTLMTEGTDKFSELFYVCDWNIDEDTEMLFKAIYSSFKNISHFVAIPVAEVSTVLKNHDFWPADKWSAEKRYEAFVKKLNDNAENYWKDLQNSENKIVVTTNDYSDAHNCVNALKTSPLTSSYFMADNPFDTRFERYYQLKFKMGNDYRCMLDLILVDHEKKILYPIDLKTSGKLEYDFFKSFLEYRYHMQARMYAEILKHNINKDDFYKDYTVANFRFIVINRNNLTPLVWEYPDTFESGTLYYGKNKQIEVRDPFEVGNVLRYYLEQNPKVPKDINLITENNLVTWLNTL